MDWMWSFVGVMVVISIPFVDGRHFALAIEDFIPVIKFLQKMHAAGYVHGDIRCFNIVFGKCLIDFDFGGKARAVTYPDGYVKELRDGYRIGKEGHKITPWHDWFALIKAMFEFHRLKPLRIALDQPDSGALALRILNMQDRQDVFMSLLHEFRDGSMEPPLREQEELPGNLIRFLEDAEREHWTVKPSDSLNDSLEDYWLKAGEVAQRKASEPATDSPPDKPSLFALGKPRRGPKRPLTVN
jgi:hypothetical protein